MCVCVCICVECVHVLCVCCGRVGEAKLGGGKVG